MPSVGGNEFKVSRNGLKMKMFILLVVPESKPERIEDSGTEIQGECVNGNVLPRVLKL